jgi:hypothetical protein
LLLCYCVFSKSQSNSKGFAGDAFLRDYVAFVPRRVLPELPAMHDAEPKCAHFEGVVSFVDLAGFTKLTERLALQVGTVGFFIKKRGAPQAALDVFFLASGLNVFALDGRRTHTYALP